MGWKRQTVTRKVKRAIKGSIEKWNLVAEGEAVDLRSRNCALCQSTPGCESCPVCQQTGRRYCRGTPYSAWATSAGRLSYSGGLVAVTVDDSARAFRMRDWLRDLDEHCRVKRRKT